MRIGIGKQDTTSPHRKPKHLDRDSMLLWMSNRKAAGQSIVFSEVCLENRDYASAIQREFRSLPPLLQPYQDFVSFQRTGREGWVVAGGFDAA